MGFNGLLTEAGLGVGAFRFLLLIIVRIWELKGGKKQIFIKDMSEISLYSHLVEKRAKRIFSRRMCMVFGFGLNHTSESSVRANIRYIYLPSLQLSIIMLLSHLLTSFSSQRNRYVFPKYCIAHIWAEMFRYGYTPWYLTSD